MPCGPGLAGSKSSEVQRADTDSSRVSVRRPLRATLWSILALGPAESISRQHGLLRGCRLLENGAARAERFHVTGLVQEPDSLPFVEDRPQVL